MQFIALRAALIRNTAAGRLLGEIPLLQDT